MRWVSAALLLAACAASCAPMPAPVPVPTPVPVPREPAPTPTPEPPPPFRLDHEPNLDVGLAWDLDSLTLVSFGGRVAWWVERAGRAKSEEGSFAALHLRRASEAPASFEGWSDERKVLESLAPGDTLWIGGSGGLKGETLRWRGKTWRGRGKVFPGPRGGLTVALRLPLETYLLGVVPGEIGALADNLIQAGRAQAIAARSYTLYYRGRRGEEGFDVYGTVEDQVYGPVEGERPIATRCVETTRGQIAISEERPIRANYYSTCGGITADVWEGWPAQDFPYLRSHRDVVAGVEMCAASPQFRWREEWPADTVVSRLAKYGPAEGLAMPAAGPGRLVDVRIATRSRSGRVWRLEFETTTGRFDVPAHSIRRVLRRPAAGEPILRSNLFKIDVRRDRATRRALAVVASGAGFGHGVGLCQTGALGMARAGRSGEDILEHYYPGVELKRFYP